MCHIGIWLTQFKISLLEGFCAYIKGMYAREVKLPKCDLVVDSFQKSIQSFFDFERLERLESFFCKDPLQDVENQMKAKLWKRYEEKKYYLFEMYCYSLQKLRENALAKLLIKNSILEWTEYIYSKLMILYIAFIDECSHAKNVEND